MRVVVIGAGGREHALAWTLARHPQVEVLAAPGNPGIARLARCFAVDPSRPEAIVDLARTERADLTVIGPEFPLARGAADALRAAGLPVFGPTRAAARRETSKSFAKAFMARHGIPTAAFEIVDTPEAARAALDRFGTPVVVKADGLASGKGVVVASTREEADAAVDAALVRGRFGEAGRQLVIEECLEGEEASFFAICDGVRALPLQSAQDHKRVFDDDRGPNTGGMGAFSPSPLFDAALERVVMTSIVEPTLRGLAADGSPFVGFLYVGLMLTGQGPRVVEFNVRFGDPEAQVVLPALAEPLAPLLIAAAEGQLPDRPVAFVPEPHVGVVLACRGYPERPETGHVIEHLEEVEHRSDVIVFHAGTAERDGRLVTAGGRVLTVVGRGPDFRTAIGRAYHAARTIKFEGCHLRSDIGRKALRALARRADG